MDIESTSGSESLLRRIMRRFGLERQLTRIRRMLGTSIAFFCIACAATLMALFVLSEALHHSSFLPYAGLIRSDFHFVAGHPGIFAFALFESAPAAFIACAFIGIAFLLVYVRLAVVYWQRMSRVSRTIRNN